MDLFYQPLRPAFRFAMVVMLLSSPIAYAASASLWVLQDGIKPPPGDGKPTSGLGSKLSTSVSRGEVVNFTLYLEAKACVTLRGGKLKSDSGGTLQPRFKFYKILPFKTDHPSFPGAPVGIHWDPVVVSDEFCDGPGWVLGEFRVPMGAAPGAYTGVVESPEAKVKVDLEVNVWKMTMPDEPAMPIYVGLVTWYALLGHYSKWSPGEAILGELYSKSLLEHRIFPMVNWVRGVDFDGKIARFDTVDGKSSEDSFTATVLRHLPKYAKFAIPNAVDTWPLEKQRTYYRAVEKALGQNNLVDRAFFYAWDEPQKAELPRVRERLSMMKREAPSVSRLVTTAPGEGLSSDLVNIFVPVADLYDSKKHARPSAGHEFWLYVSCMSHGCDQNLDSGAPDWVIDRPAGRLRAFSWLGMALGADALLYYAAVNSYQFYRQDQKGKVPRDPWSDLWEFGGNGDGTLFYPGRPGMFGHADHFPVESLRLKIWRQASYDAQYIAWMNALKPAPAWWADAYRGLIRGPKSVSSDNAGYERLKERAGRHLNGL